MHGKENVRDCYALYKASSPCSTNLGSLCSKMFAPYRQIVSIFYGMCCFMNVSSVI